MTKGLGLLGPAPHVAISLGDVVFAIALVRQQLDNPTRASLHVASETLDALEFRLVTDCLELDIDLEHRVLF